MKKIIIEALHTLNIPFEENVDLKRKTWIHRGGIAQIFISPRNATELEQIARFLYRNNIDFFIFGHTSNLYIKNTRDLDVVISTMKCNAVDVTDNCIVCEAGTSVIKLSHQMIEHGITGFEYLTELPGTVGAALVNNSSCKENSISKLLLNATVLFPNGSKRTLSPGDFCFSYRNSVFKSGILKGTILTVTLKRLNGDTEVLKKIAIDNSRERVNRLGGHGKNLGCTVNKKGSSGRMGLKYYLPMQAIKLWGKIMNNDSLKTNRHINRALCKLAHCRQVEPYISPYNPIVFIWEDEGADDAFPTYLSFMKKVYGSDSLEIQVIE